MTAAPAAYIPDLPPHVLKALRLIEELAEAKRISTVEHETISRAIVRRAPGHEHGDGHVVPGWALEGHVSAPSLDEVVR